MSTNCTTPLGSEALISKAIKAFFLSIIFVLALLLNVKTFLVLLKRNQQHRNVVTIFLLNLTLVSALMVLQVPFNIHAIVDQGWVFGEAFCQFNGFSNVFLCMNLIFTLLCLTIDRYLAVVKPLRHRTLMNHRTAYHMLVVVYFLSFLLAVIPILGKARYKYHPGTNHCSPAWSNSCGYAAGMTTVAFIIPILGMLVTYTRIFITLRSKRVLMKKSASSTMSSNEIPLHYTDSNSLGNFEDTSTDPSGDGDVIPTANKPIVCSKQGILEYEVQPGPSNEYLAEKDLTEKKTATAGNAEACKITGHPKERLTENTLETCFSRESLSRKDSITKDTKESSVECDVEAWKPDEHSTEKFHSMVKDIKSKDNVNTRWGDNDVSSLPRKYIENDGFNIQHEASKTPTTYIDVIGRDMDVMYSNDYGTGNKDVPHTIRLSNVHVSVDSTENSLSSNLADQEFVSTYTAGGKKQTLSCLESSVSSSSTGADIFVAEKETPRAPTSDFESDLARRETRTKVSFQNSTKVSPLKIHAKEGGTSKRMFSILPVSRSRRAINFVVTRMKKQRAIRHEYKIARTGTILLLSFLMLWMPYVIAHSCFVGKCRSVTFYNIASFLVYTNALANPIVYALTNRAVMQDIRKSFGKLCK